MKAEIDRLLQPLDNALQDTGNWVFLIIWSLLSFCAIYELFFSVTSCGTHPLSSRVGCTLLSTAAGLIAFFLFFWCVNHLLKTSCGVDV